MTTLLLWFKNRPYFVITPCCLLILGDRQPSEVSDTDCETINVSRIIKIYWIFQSSWRKEEGEELWKRQRQCVYMCVCIHIWMSKVQRSIVRCSSAGHSRGNMLYIRPETGCVFTVHCLKAPVHAAVHTCHLHRMLGSCVCDVTAGWSEVWLLLPVSMLLSHREPSSTPKHQIWTLIVTMISLI